MRKNDQIVVFRTGSLVEFDSVTGALEDAGVPYFTREETSAGLRLATPASPSVGPGTWWMVVVPCGAAEDARTIISAFPFSDKTSLGVWDFQPSKKSANWMEDLRWWSPVVLFACRTPGIVSGV
jgi:hypothetical protein